MKIDPFSLQLPQCGRSAYRP
eukprot:COSAG02_NODE_5008_length_4726_cov_3.358764_1_plen_20_part_10